jgi:hypothetical protein
MVMLVVEDCTTEIDYLDSRIVEDVLRLSPTPLPVSPDAVVSQPRHGIHQKPIIYSGASSQCERYSTSGRLKLTKDTTEPYMQHSVKSVSQIAGLVNVGTESICSLSGSHRRFFQRAQ